MKQEYPKWLYSGSQPACIVVDAQAHQALGPGWFESPGEARDGASVTADSDLPSASGAATAPPVETVTSAVATPPAAAPPSDLPAGSGPSDPPVQPQSDPPVSAEAAKAQADAERAELYATAVPKILVKLKGASKATLERVAVYEAENPKGARTSLIKAIAAIVGAA